MTDPTWSTGDYQDALNRDYSIDKFYTGSSDGKGHTTRMRVSIPPSVAALIGAVIESKRIPQYRRFTDFVRDAVQHRLHWVAEHLDDPHIKEQSKLTRFIAEQETRRQRVDEWEQWLTTLEMNCSAFATMDTDMLEAEIDQADEVLMGDVPVKVRERAVEVLRRFRR